MNFRNISPRSIFVSLTILLAFYSYCSSTFSKNKPLWQDEKFGLGASTRPASWSSLIIEGAKGQGSPAPLYYLALKAFDPGARFLINRNVDENVVYRWLTLLIILAGSLIFVLRRRTENVSLTIFLVFLVLFAKETFYYASEARPYGLWFIGSLLFLDGFRRPYAALPWIALCICLASTATASIFLFLGGGAAMLIANLLHRDDAQSTPVWWLGIIMGVLISFYYSLRAGQWPYQLSGTDTWATFLRFMWSYKWPILGSLFLIFEDCRLPEKGKLPQSLTLLIWFAIGPVIFWVTIYKGFFFSERQYIYWTISTVFVVDQLMKKVLARPFGEVKGHSIFWINTIFLILSVKRLDLWATFVRLLHS